MKILQLSLLIAGLFLCSMGFGQDVLRGKLEGRLSDGNTEALVGATVFWQGSQNGTISDEKGAFELKRSRKSTQLVVRYGQWPADTFPIGPDQQDISLSLREPTDLEEVKITSRIKSSSFARMDPFGIELLNQSELRKAACCNLSESFETNPSVDVAFSDAVTGARQIRMLGLAGQYVAITNENMPLLHGLAAVDGLGFIPGPWIDGIQLSKGAGTVVNGYEAIAGQINLAYKDPFDEEILHLNGYINQAGRMEGNLIAATKVSKTVGTNLLLHANNLNTIQDQNDDKFLDMPMHTMYNGMNRWKYEGDNGICAQVNLTGLYHQSRGGQVDFFDDADFLPKWGYENTTKRGQAFAKIGWFSPKNPLWSIGTQWMALYHDQMAQFGDKVYNGKQKSFYSNIIGQMPLGPQDKHLIKAGFSYQTDNYEESLNNSLFPAAIFDQVEQIPGVFAEFTYSPSPRLDLVVGLRSDWHNSYGQFWTPRLNMRYDLSTSTILRIAGGRGQRTTRPLSDHLGLLASNRQLEFTRPPLNLPGYGYQPEVGWNVGLSLTQNFFLDFREGTVRADFYRTQFQNQLVVDRESPFLLDFYSQPGLSYANSFLVEASYEVVKRFDVRMAYRFYDVRQSYTSGLKTAPFTPQHRGFINLAYKTRLSKWAFDFTWQRIGEQRIPDLNYTESTYSPSFSQLSAQISKGFGKRWELYLGGENLTNFRQENPIIQANDVTTQGFDATMVWAPIFGRNIYGGFRFSVLRVPE